MHEFRGHVKVKHNIRLSETPIFIVFFITSAIFLAEIPTASKLPVISFNYQPTTLAPGSKR